MKKLISLSLLVAFLAFAMSGCGPAPTEAPTAKPTEEPTTEGPSLGDTWTRPADGMVMVYVPAGEFQMGNAEGDAREQPVHTVALDGFWMDRTEVTNTQYRQCVEAGACDPPARVASSSCASYYSNSAYDDYPVINVTWHQAVAYCEWAGVRLPTEAEWEYAARGPEGWIYPWGDDWDASRLNSLHAGLGDPTEVGSYQAGASWCGALDMAGNVWEWIADWYGVYYYSRSPSRNPSGPSSGRRRVVRGGSWVDFRVDARSTVRGRYNPDRSNTYIGFRCVSPVSP